MALDTPRRTHRVARLSALAVSLLLGWIVQVRAEGAWELRSAHLAPRTGAAALVDTVHGTLYLYGGAREENLGQVSFVTCGDVHLWAMDLESRVARPVTTTGSAAPVGVSRYPAGPHGAVFDAERNQLVFLGGYPRSLEPSDSWLLSLSTMHWIAVPSATGPSFSTDRPAVVLDAEHDRVLVWFENPSSGIWGLSLTGGGWQALATIGTPPTTLSIRVAAIDPVRNRLVVAGGSSSPGTWSLTLGTPMEWSQLSATGPAPTPTNGYAFMDTRSDQLVHIGEWDTDSWPFPYGPWPNVVSALSFAGDPDAPSWRIVRPYDTLDIPTRYQSSMAFDARTGRALSFGGVLPFDPVYDVHEQIIGFTGLTSADLHQFRLDGPGTWEQLPLGTPILRRQAAALDPVQRRILVVSGVGEASYEVGISGAGAGGYRFLAPTQLLPGLNQHTVVLDAAGDRLILFGSRFSPPSVALLSMPLHGTPEWLPLVATGTAPGPRTGATAVYDPAGHRMFLFGGDSLGVYKNDTYELSLDGTPHWTRITGPAPSARSGHVAVYDPQGDRMIIQGGRSVFGLRNDTWQLSLAGTPEWSPITFEGLVEILPREGATAVLDVARHRLLVFGGRNDSYAMNDLWELPLDDNARWRAVTPTTAVVPTARWGATSAYDPATGDWWLIGGVDLQGNPVPDVWTFSDPSVVGVGGDRATPALALSTPAPNPTREGTSFALSLPTASHVRLDVFDVGGRSIRTQPARRYEAGRHTITWDGRDGSGARPAPGLYFVMITGAGAPATRRVVLLEGGH